MPRSIRFLAASVAAVVFTACASGARTASAGTQNAVPSAAQTAIANAIEVANAPFVGSKKSKRFYPSSCSTVKLIKAVDQVGFASIKDAESAGFTKDAFSTDCSF